MRQWLRFKFGLAQILDGLIIVFTLGRVEPPFAERALTNIVLHRIERRKNAKT